MYTRFRKKLYSTAVNIFTICKGQVAYDQYKKSFNIVYILTMFP